MISFPDFSATVSLFPTKLYRMVNDDECLCMRWAGDGEQMLINTRQFEDELLQNTHARWKYQLKTTSTTSFIRQLHAYGFRKVIDTNAIEVVSQREPTHIRRYFHPYFHRDRPDLLMFMKRGVRPQPAKRQRSSLAAAEISASAAEGDNVLPNSPSKRKRKAKPKRHPSFDYECAWDDNSEIQDDGCKQESKLEATKHSIQIKEKIDEPKAMRNCYNCVADNAVNNDSHKQDDENMEEDLSLENEDLLKNKGGDNPECIETEENIVEQAFTDQPLDLSCQGTFNMYTTSHAFPEEATKPSGEMQQMNTSSANLTGTMIHGKRGGVPIGLPTSDSSQPQVGYAHNNPFTVYQVPGQIGYPAPRIISSPTPFPMANGSANLRYSFLQPAYIAWPTRRMYCPQSKQWVQPRPQIIPLPFKTQFAPQQLTPGNTEIANGAMQVAGMPGLLQKLNADSNKGTISYQEQKSIFATYKTPTEEKVQLKVQKN
ncbi:uncharacterized protein LOC143448764 isoform X2 [Clavelina lepadiformis]|uniref:uncharacterized protein LOC143448764 isoform X2 n=1 Tax=Clavelina lepadiformis TaxID=159417 RepID=UPI0040438E49